jgi:hypothetical protein
MRSLFITVLIFITSSCFCQNRQVNEVVIRRVETELFNNLSIYGNPHRFLDVQPLFTRDVFTDFRSSMLVLPVEIYPTGRNFNTIAPMNLGTFGSPSIQNGLNIASPNIIISNYNISNVPSLPGLSNLPGTNNIRIIINN